jgi:hypothetical protein
MNFYQLIAPFVLMLTLDFQIEFSEPWGGRAPQSWEVQPGLLENGKYDFPNFLHIASTSSPLQTEKKLGKSIEPIFFNFDLFFCINGFNSISQPFIVRSHSNLNSRRRTMRRIDWYRHFRFPSKPEVTTSGQSRHAAYSLFTDRLSSN